VIKKCLDNFQCYSNLDKGIRTAINKVKITLNVQIFMSIILEKRCFSISFILMKDNIANTSFLGPQSYFPHEGKDWALLAL